MCNKLMTKQATRRQVPAGEAGLSLDSPGATDTAGNAKSIIFRNSSTYVSKIRWYKLIGKC